MVKGIVRFTQTYHKDTKITSKNSSTVLLKFTENGIEDTTNYNFGYQLTHCIGRCSNLLGARSVSWCTHLSVSLLLLHYLIEDSDIPDPTPFISKQFSKVKNISNFIYTMNKKIPSACTTYLENIFDEDDYKIEDETNNIIQFRGN